jgi:hypothetical protein
MTSVTVRGFGFGLTVLSSLQVASCNFKMIMELEMPYSVVFC